MVKIAINGFGRIGRAAFKIALEHEDEIEIVAINDLGNIENLAYLLRYDTVYGRYNRDIKVTETSITVGDKEVAVVSESDPASLPWGDMGIDVVIESTGVFTEREKAQGHIDAGAKNVVISAPTKSDDLSTVVVGVNDKDLGGNDIVSNASCTTNCAGPVISTMDKVFGVKKALLTTVHAYTATQSLVDGPTRKSDFRRGRAAAQNMIPSSTGAAVAVTKAYAPLENKFDGVALRVPVPVVSMADFSFVTKKKVTVEDINAAFEDAVENPLLNGVLGATSDPVVSSDFIGDPRSAIVDLNMTRVVDGDLVKVMAWYDNEWGYSNRLVEQVIALGKGE